MFVLAAKGVTQLQDQIWCPQNNAGESGKRSDIQVGTAKEKPDRFDSFRWGLKIAVPGGVPVIDVTSSAIRRDSSVLRPLSGAQARHREGW